MQTLDVNRLMILLYSTHTLLTRINLYLAIKQKLCGLLMHVTSPSNLSPLAGAHVCGVCVHLWSWSAGPVCPLQSGWCR